MFIVSTLENTGKTSQFEPHFLIEVITEPQSLHTTSLFLFLPIISLHSSPYFFIASIAIGENIFVYIFHLLSKYFICQAGEVRGERPKVSALEGLKVSADVILVSPIRT